MPQSSPAIVTLPAPSQAQVSVVVPTAKVAPEMLERCLRALAVQEDVPFETVLVLNDPTPELVAFVRDRVRGARVVASVVNRGFAGGANLGAREARGALLLFTHDDAELQPER